MSIDGINATTAVARVKALLAQEKSLSPALAAALEVLLLLVGALLNRLTLDSANSSKPPSTDPHRERRTKSRSTRQRGGQPGHVGTTLQPVSEPDEVQVLRVNRASLPKGRYREVGFEPRQVIDIQLRRVVTEYRAQILQNAQGERFTAPFPEGVTAPVQYGNSVKVQAVYQSQFQLIPYKRVEDYFAEQLIPISAGSLYHFNQQAWQALASFDNWVIDQLSAEAVLHADETGINIGGKRHWLHCAGNERFTYYFAHAKRGLEAMESMGILPRFDGVLVHDHWKPYYHYRCTHALCNAHHLRELERAFEQDNQSWAKDMQQLLLDLNEAVEAAGGALSAQDSQAWRLRYRALLREADNQCPPPDDTRRPGQRGRLKRSKSRNLLERLRDFEDDVLRFIDEPLVPFTNNQGENDIRMTKLHQKISGCFRSKDGADIFCRIRSYLSTCRKQGLSATEALRLLFAGKQPAFMLSG